MKDITNQKIGYLTAIRPDVKDKKQRFLWLFKCVCGKEVVRTPNGLKETSSCGCKHTRWMKNYNKSRRLPDGESGFRRLYQRYRTFAGYRKRNFELSMEEFRILTKKICNYCGVEPRQVCGLANLPHTNYVYNGIDRLDNNEGYNNKNCVSCCGTCNVAKNKLSEKEFLEWLHRLVQFQNSSTKS